MAKVSYRSWIGAMVDCGGVVGDGADAEEAEYHGSEDDTDYLALLFG